MRGLCSPVSVCPLCLRRRPTGLIASGSTFQLHLGSVTGICSICSTGTSGQQWCQCTGITEALPVQCHYSADPDVGRVSLKKTTIVFDISSLTRDEYSYLHLLLLWELSDPSLGVRKTLNNPPCAAHHSSHQWTALFLSYYNVTLK